MQDFRRLKNYKPSEYKAPMSIYREKYADAAVLFCQHLRHTTGKWHGQPFQLIDWQERLLRDLFGIVKQHNRCRQFRTAYVEIPKKNGKSELAAAVALLLTCCDMEKRAEVYGCATDRSQASIVFDVAVHMVEQFPYLKQMMKLHLSQKRMTFKPLDSFYQVCSAEAYTKDGINVHGLIFDELHAQKDRRLFDVMTSGSGMSREQPMTFIITTAGFDRNSICYEQHQKAVEIIRGKIYDPTFYPVVFGAEDDADWTSPEVWKAVNPSYGITISEDNFLLEYEKALLNPATENNFRRLNLNQWVKQSTRWMPMSLWDKCDFPVDRESLKGKKCWCGLDLSKSQDMTAFVMIFPPDDVNDEDEKYRIIGHYWIPEKSLEKRVTTDKVPYDQWLAQGLIETTDSEIINYNYVQKKIIELGQIYDIQEIAFDRWGSTMLMQNLRDAGFTVVDFGQGFASMSQPMEELMRHVITGRIAHGGCKVLRWNFDNIMVHHDESGNIRPDKKRSTEKIDAAVATFMAFGRAVCHDNDDNPYADGGGLAYYDPAVGGIVKPRG